MENVLKKINLEQNYRVSRNVLLVLMNRTHVANYIRCVRFNSASALGRRPQDPGLGMHGEDPL